MPNIKSAKKRVLVNKKKTLQNQMAKSALKTQLKKFDAAVAAQDRDKALSEFKVSVKTIDKACCKGVLHKNTAARRKSSLALRLSAVE